MQDVNQPILEPKSKRILPKILLGFLIVIFLLLGVVLVKTYNASGKIFVSKTSFFKRVQSLVLNNSGELQGEEQNQVNILLLGYRGSGQDGPYLTDTMILASINPETNKVLLTSIPRDFLWKDDLDSPKKINSAFAYGLNGKGDFANAGTDARQAVEKLTGLDVPYFFSVDFQGFKKAIDAVDGVDVNVERSFSDSEYPDEGIGYLPTQTFSAGQQHMNGARALIYARSRHGDNGEGSDFARSKRQAVVISALKDKIRALNILSNTNTLDNLLNIVSDHLHTNMEPSEILRLEKILHDGEVKIFSKSFDPSSNLICETRLENQDRTYVLIPCDNVSQGAIKNWFIDQLAYGDVYGGIQDEKATLIIENASADKTKFASLLAELQSAGIAVTEVTYKGLPVMQNYLYEVNPKPVTEKFIEEKLNIQHQPKPENMKASTDMVLIIGSTY